MKGYIVRCSSLYSIFAVVLLPLLVLQDAAASDREVFNIEVDELTFRDDYLPTKSVTAHSFENLLSFLHLDQGVNVKEVARVLSAIPHNITVDVATSTSNKDSDRPLVDFMERICILHTPTYLFHFRRPDIITEFGNGYFLLRPSLKNTKDAMMTFKPRPAFELQPPPPEADEEESFLLPPPPQSLRGSRRVLEKPTTKGEPRKLWLHVQKTGTSFQSSARNLGYQDHNHDPCRPGSQCEMITLLREPIERIISWFYYSPELFEECDAAHSLKDVSTDIYKKSLQDCFNDMILTHTSKRHFSQSDYWGCEAKMLIGYHCDDDIDMLPVALRTEQGLINAAIGKMRDGKSFKFIGNTAFFEASVTLLHQLLGGTIDLTEDFDKLNTRRVNEVNRPQSGNKKLDSIHYDSRFLCEGNNLCENGPDVAVFNEVKAMMIENIMQNHNVPVQVFGKPLDFDSTYRYHNQVPSTSEYSHEGTLCRAVSAKAEKRYRF